MSVYRVTEITGTSSTSWEDAAAEAIRTAAGTLRSLRVAEVVKQDIHLDEGGAVTASTLGEDGTARNSSDAGQRAPGLPWRLSARRSAARSTGRPDHRRGGHFRGGHGRRGSPRPRARARGVSRQRLLTWPSGPQGNGLRPQRADPHS
jgi:dodecin